VRFAQGVEPGKADTFGEPQKSRLNIRRQGSDLLGNRLVEDFDPPSRRKCISKLG
jgi:hypothetical protein